MSPSRGTHAAQPFRLHTLGGLSLVAPGGEIVRPQRRRLALLVIAAAAGDRGISRDKLIALLSPESTTESARHSLHQLLYYLRQQLGDDVFIGSDPLSLNPGIVTSDLAEFESAIEKRELERAADLYRGPFLEGFHISDSPEFDEWSSAQRTRLAAMHADALLALAADATARGDHAAATRWWRTLASIDPLSSRAALGLMRSLSASGDSPAALVHARNHETLVRNELGSSPDPEITAFVAHLHEQRAAIDRPAARASVRHPAETLTIATASAKKRTRGPVAIGLFAAAIVGYVIFSGNAARSSAVATAPFSASDQILVGDFSAPAGDSLASRALSEALRGSLAASRAVAVVSRAEVDRALRRMEKPVSTPLEGSVVDELAARNGYEATLTGSITPFGKGYVLSARLTTVGGKELASLSESAANPDALIPAVGRLSKALRRTIGESSAMIDSVKPLEQVTTSSLRALQLYTRAFDESREGRGESQFTLGLLREAIATDPAFAMAHRYLGIKLYLLDSTQQALRHLRLAEKFSGRLTEIERLSAMSTLHLVLRDYERSYDEAAAVLRLDPNSLWAINQLGLNANFLGRYEQGKQVARARSRLDSTGRSHLTVAALYAGDYRAALAESRRFFKRYEESTGSPSSAEARRLMGLVHSAVGAFDSTEYYAIADGPLDRGDPVRLAQSLLARGQLKRAFEVMGVRGSASDRAPSRDFSAVAESQAAMATVIMAGDKRSAARRLDAVLADPEYRRAAGPNARVAPVLALAIAGRAADARRELTKIERTADRDLLAARLPEVSLARGAVALAENRVPAAMDAFRTASKSFSFMYDACRVCSLPWLGRTYEAAGLRDSAIAIYERFLSTGDPDRIHADAMWRGVVLRQLGSLHAQNGDTARAIRRLDEFAALWNAADPELRPQVADARRLSSRLRAVRTSELQDSRK